MDTPQTFPPEPEEVYPEEAFQKALTGLFARAQDQCRSGTLIRNFGLDFAWFCWRNGQTRVVFVEAKSYGGQRQGGVGFGNRRGEGPQVEILLSDEMPLFDACVRWAFADATRRPGSRRYALLNCTEAKSAVMNRVARDKQNNFRLSALSQHLVCWEEFAKELLAFLCGATL